MRGEGDSAIEWVVFDGVAGDEIVVGLAGVVADEDAAGVALDEVVGDGGEGDAHDVDAFAAVEVFAGFKGRLAGASSVDDIEEDIVVENVVALDDDVGGVGNEDTLVVGVLEGEAGDEYVTQARIVETIDIDGVGEDRWHRWWCNGDQCR